MGKSYDAEMTLGVGRRHPIFAVGLDLLVLQLRTGHVGVVLDPLDHCFPARKRKAIAGR